MSRFAAIDFETANYSPDSACAVGIVVVDHTDIVERAYHLIRPPTAEFVFTYIHGLTWQDVQNAPEFREIWSALSSKLNDVDFIAAHNAPFDRRVLETCCRSNQLPVPEKRYECTVQIARSVWRLPSAKLPDVCHHLGLPLSHHDAMSDAEACAGIVIAARKAGWRC